MSPTESKEVLRIEGLSKAFQSAGGKNEILNDLRFSVHEREFVCILGPSGCGKTTLLRCIAGFEDFTGTAECNGKRISRPAPDRIMVFQDYNQLFPWLTVAQNIIYPLKVQKLYDKQERKHQADIFLSKVGLDGYQNYYPHELSGGMKQRVAIAKALAQKPDLILMDEPFAALDAITRNSLQRELYRISVEETITVLFVTHNIQEALTLGTRIFVMGSGRILLDEPNTLPKPVTPSVPGYGEMWDHFSAAIGGQAPAGSTEEKDRKRR